VQWIAFSENVELAYSKLWGTLTHVVNHSLGAAQPKIQLVYPVLYFYTHNAFTASGSSASSAIMSTRMNIKKHTLIATGVFLAEKLVCREVVNES